MVTPDGSGPKQHYSQQAAQREQPKKKNWQDRILKIKEGKATCCHQRMTPKKPFPERVWPVSRHGEVTPAQIVLLFYSLRFFLWRRHFPFPESSLMLFAATVCLPMFTSLKNFLTGNSEPIFTVHCASTLWIWLYSQVGKFNFFRMNLLKIISTTISQVYHIYRIYLL